jgi:superoxide reductase
MIKDLIQSGDWKGEKHVPVIHAPETVRPSEEFEVRVSIGDEIRHPNTIEHHINWIKLYYKAYDEKFPVELASFNFSAHGEYDKFTNPLGVTKVVVSKPGILYALSYCNIHGLWENSKELIVEEK